MAMFERIQTDGSAPKAASTSVNTRVELAVAPAPVHSELRDRAVSAPVQGHRTGRDEDRLHMVVNAVGQLRSAVDAVSSAEANEKTLEDLYSRLFRGYQASKSDGGMQDLEGAEAAAEELDKLTQKIFGSQSTEAGAENAENAADWGLRTARERTEAKIDLALRQVGVLRNKLSEDRATAYDRLVNINSSVSGLNMARTQVDNNSFSIASASSAVDAVMVNLRSMVTAHGNVSPEIARLILS